MNLKVGCFKGIIKYKKVKNPDKSPGRRRNYFGWCSCFAYEKTASPDGSESPNNIEDVKLLVEDAEEEFEWPVVPPDELEMDNEELLYNQNSASLVKTLDQVIEVFSSVTKGKKKHSAPPGASPLPDKSNWKTIQKLVLPSESDVSEGGRTGLVDQGQYETESADEEVLEISVNRISKYSPAPLCYSQNDVRAAYLELDVDAETSISDYEQCSSPKSHRTSTHSTNITGTDSPRTRHRADLLRDSRDYGNPGDRIYGNPGDRIYGNPPSPCYQTKSKSVVLTCTNMNVDPASTPDLSIRKIFASKSLNDIVFSEEEYEFAAV